MKKLLVLRLDAIGDYVIFRQALKSLRFAPLFKDCEITLCGNKSWQNLAENFDSAAFDKSIWLDTMQLYNNDYLKAVAEHLQAQHFDLAFCPVHSRTCFMDYLIYASQAPIRLAPFGDNVNNVQKAECDKFYNFFLNFDFAYDFELIKNYKMCQSLSIAEENIPPYIQAFPQDIQQDIQISQKISEHKNKIVFFIASMTPQRRWQAENWIQLAKLIAQKSELEIVLAGASDVLSSAQEILAQSGSNLSSLVAETSLTELAYLISTSPLLISGDSSAVHLAASFNTPHIILGAGNYFRRFVPYPKEIMPESHILYPQNYTVDNAQEKYYDPTMGEVNSITPHQVMELINFS